MEHQQHYKMSPYDASSRVPLVIYAPGFTKNVPRVVTTPTQLIDLYPTIMEMAGAGDAKPTVLDGFSLLPILADEEEGHNNDDDNDERTRPPFVVSQFHGDNIAMSWFLIREGDYKLVVYGTGTEVEDQLFHLGDDPNERINLAVSDAQNATILEVLARLDDHLRSVVDYPEVALDVAEYNLNQFLYWTNHTDDWQDEIHNPSLRWTESWDMNSTASFDALYDWMAQSPPLALYACRGDLTWPPLPE
jgi:arylsulfatase A-like enzyme